MDSTVVVAMISGSTGLLGIGLKAYFDSRKVQQELELKKLHEAKSCPPLTMHSLFNRMEVYLQQVHNTFSIPNKGKEAVFRCLLDHNLRICQKNLYALAVELDKKLDKDIEPEELYMMFSECLRKNLLEFENFYKNSSFSADEQKSLEIVMRKFAHWHQSRVDYINETLYTICCSSLFYKDAYVKSVTLLDIYSAVFADTLRDAQHTLNSVNGDLQGLVFKGYTI